MEFKVKCDNCENDLSARVTEDAGSVIILCEPCPNCIARAILQSEDDAWMRNKFLKEGRAA